MSPRPAPELVTTRVPVNAVDEFMAAGHQRREPAPPEALAALSAPKRSPILDLSRMAQDPHGPLRGYWVVFSRLERAGPEGQDSRFLSLRSEPAPSPHRSPLAYGAHAGPRGPSALAEETRSYWEAIDLRQALPAAPRRLRGSPL